MRFFNIEKILKFSLLAVFMASAIWLIIQPMEVLLGNFLADDAFYYFKPASYLAEGLKPVFDGEHLTNGYHPLWMGIMTAVYYFFPSDKITPIYIALIFSSAFLCLFIWVFWKILSVFSKDEFLKSILVALLILNPWNIVNFLNGLETSLQMLLFALFFWIFLRIFYGEDKPQNFFLLGILGGLLVLARVDYGLFLVAPAAYFTFKQRDFWGKRAMLFFLPAFLLPIPWFIYNKIYFGSYFPTSGLAYTLVNHRLFFYKARTALTVLFWSLYNFFGATAFSLKTAGLPVFYNILERWKSVFLMGGIYILFPVILIFYFLKNKKEDFKKFLKDLFNSPEWLSFIIFSAGYLGLLIVHGGIRWSGRAWYFAPFSMLFLLAGGIVLNREFFSRWRKVILTVMSAILLFSYADNFHAVFYENEGQKEAYRIALWLRDNMPTDARITSFNSGILGYFSDRFVMNADGLINQSAYDAMKENKLWEFFKEERIDYIVDYEITLTYRFLPFLGIDDPMARVRKIDLPAELSLLGSYGGSQIKVYKLLYE